MSPSSSAANNSLITSLLLLILVCLSSCSSPWKRKEIFKIRDIVIYKEHREVDGKIIPLDYAHPAEISPEKLAVILSQLSYRNKTWFQKAEKFNVFSPEEVSELAEALSLSLKSVNRDERLRFLMISSNWSSALTGLQATSGVLFEQPKGTLNLAFGRVREKVVVGESGRADSVSFPHDPTEFRDHGRIVPITGSQLHYDPKTRQDFPLWLVIDLAKVKKAEKPPPEKPPPEKKEQEEKPKEEEKPSTQKEPPPPAQPPNKYDELKTKLKTLEQLRDDGVITEEQYKEQFEKVMSDL